VDLLMKLDPGRPIFNHGLEGLKLPGRSVTEFDASEWPSEVPDGAVVVIDEAQSLWRPRGTGSKVPEHVAQLETHRHRGLDFFCTTQAPRLIDANVRSLAGRHVHIRDQGILGRKAYEWPECNEAMTWRSCVNKWNYKLPKKTFDHYVSASIHTKPVRKVPPALLWAAFAVLAACVLVFMVYRVVARSGGSHEAPAKPGPAVSSAVAAVAPGAGVYGAIDDRVDWVPRVSSKPESAPAYDTLRKVVAMPVVAGCMEFGGKARCFTQQGTDAGLSELEARAWIERRPFNPYEQPALPGQGAQVAQVGQQLHQVDQREAPGLVILDGPGWRDPIGARGSTAVAAAGARP